jgi:CHAT domain-containing protein/tetratricopeptide (TPR) repeat protein
LARTFKIQPSEFLTLRMIGDPSICLFTSLFLVIFTSASAKGQHLRVTHPLDGMGGGENALPQVTAQQSDNIGKISPGAPVIARISGGESHDYHINLIKGCFFKAVIDKGDLNIQVVVYGVADSKRARFISRRYGPLLISLVARDMGLYRLQILSLEKNPRKRSYELRIDTISAATSQDEKYELAVNAFANAESLRATWKKESLNEAIKKYTQAYDLWQSIGALSEAIGAQRNIGDVYFTLSQYSLALDAYGKALTLSEQIADHMRVMEELNCIAYVHIYSGHNQTSLEYSKRVLDYLSKAPSPIEEKQRLRLQAQALNNIGEIYYSVPNIKLALDFFGQSLESWVAAGDRAGQALTCLNIGYAQTDTGNLHEGLEQFKRASILWSEVEDYRGQALSSTAMGGVYSFLGEGQSALDSHQQALDMLQKMGDQQGVAATLNGIGKVYEDMNEPSRALDCYNQSLKIYQEIHNREFESLTRYYIGRVYRSMGENQEAFSFYNESLRLSREVPNLRIQAYALKDIALINGISGRTQSALQQYNEVLELFDKIEDRRGQAYTLHSIGRIYYRLNDAEAALSNYKKALDLMRAVQDRRGEIAILYNMARAERDRGNADEALRYLDASIKAIEFLRARIVNQDLRASYFASAQSHYDLYINLLIDKHRSSPGAGFEAAAFEASERARARLLLEMLEEAKIDIRQGIDPALLKKESYLQQLLNAKAEGQTRLLNGKHTEEQAQVIAKELDTIIFDYQKVKAEIKAKGSRYASFTQPELVTLKQVQQELLSPDTLLLEYFLGEERSFLWAITPSSINQFELPKREEVESLAYEVCDLLTARNVRPKDETIEQRRMRLAKAAKQYSEAASKLSHVLLGQLPPTLRSKRLLIIPDGALHHVSFAALPIISEGAGRAQKEIPLVINHEIITLPSASTLTMLRKEITTNEPTPNVIAVIADPVFDSDDVRVIKKGRPPASENQSGNDARSIERGDLKKALRDTGGRDGPEKLSRLLFTRLEAEEILKLVDRSTSKKAVGFKASKATATSHELALFQIVHFATHGIADSAHPELSGIILSLVDEHGTAQDGFLRLHEIYNLKLPAKLVVLSACETGLGKQVRGEGLIGLTRGFMYAGAARVIASLWSVRDEATAELMKRFYSGMLKEGKTASAALQAAQASMWSDSDWKSPYYWAGFIIQGEWK